MHNGKFVFSQLFDFIDCDVFLRISNKYNGNRYVKNFTCWNQSNVRASIYKELLILNFSHSTNKSGLNNQPGLAFIFI